MKGESVEYVFRRKWPFENGDDVAFTLISDFFPIGGANYTFGVQLISACSSTALSPKNGAVLADGVTVTFLISARTEPAISITPIDESGAVIQSNIYDYGSDVILQVAIQYKPAGTELVLRLLNKNEKGVYLDAGWSKTVTEINDPHAVPLGRLTGSCCIVLELRNNDAGNDVIMSAYYYFVIRE